MLQWHVGCKNLAVRMADRLLAGVGNITVRQLQILPGAENTAAAG
ncbi:hypothetical protein BVRB_5g117980 [Beta vulgaris subsp. vulgaris]|nr:hypothetical protein BVRB_5g117980 [Beta vulgaris subsp. vulgaris]